MKSRQAKKVLKSQDAHKAHQVHEATASIGRAVKRAEKKTQG